MGRQAVHLFEQAERIGGLRAKIALAVHTRVPSTEAASGPDTPELISRLEAGLAHIRLQFQGGIPPRGDESQRVSIPQPAGGASAELALRRHQQTYLELMSQRSLLLGNVDTTFRRITEAASHALDVERVSVWRVDPQVTKITCADLYQRTEQSHSSGLELHARDFGTYFAALKGQRTIAAHDAHTDPRTSCFSASYLAPLGIGAMLDVPIWLGETMVGVVCHEHVGPIRTWTQDEETFAYLMSAFASLAMEMMRLGRPTLAP